MVNRNSNDVRAALLLRRAELNERLTRVDSDLERRNDPLTADSEDRAVQLQNDDVLVAIESGAREEIASIDQALQRLESHTYGLCKRCNQPIPEARLHAAPYATNCTQCVTA